MDLEHIEFGALLESISSRTPTPGGGAVAAAVGALAAALSGMVISYSVGRKSLGEHEPALRDAGALLQRARRLLLDLGREDAEAYGLVSELSRLPADDPRRQAEYGPALLAATHVPRATIAACVDLLRLFEAMTTTTNPNLRSDLAIAAVLAEAAVRASRWNVLVNLPMLEKSTSGGVLASADIRREVDEAMADADARRAAIESACTQQAP